MNPTPPQEEKEVVLPQTCYFWDLKTKVDYVIVVPKIEEGVREDRSQALIKQFVAQMRNKGLLVERDVGKFYSTLVFLKIHGPHKVLTRYAPIYNVGLTCQNPYYKYRETFVFKFLTTELTRPDPHSSIYKRAEKTLSGARPVGMTTAERSKIVHEILKRISFTFEDEEITLKSMLEREVFLEAYPIHDGDCAWTKDGNLTDRQLLYRFWPNVRYLVQEQPIHLIEKYYGPKLAFYFALASLYTKMLLVPTVVGTLTILVGFGQLFQENNYLENEVCKSNVVLCSDQKLKTACSFMKLAYVIDNPATIVYVILCSFWGVVFWNLWLRRQSMLRLRWNLMGVKADRTMRREFQENAKTRKSSITGEIEYYIPPYKKVLSAMFTYLIILIMVFIFFSVVFLVIEYRFLLRRHLVYDQISNANEIEVFTSCILTAIIIIILEGLSPYVVKMYATIVRFLTLLRTPRTQRQYNRMYLHMIFIITFANNFSPLFYLAFVKGFFHKYPGDLSDNGLVKKVQSDLCTPAGCLLDLGVQLIAIMVFKTARKCCFSLAKYFVSVWTKDGAPGLHYGQWENDFAMKEIDDSAVNELYTDLVLQYSFITFFNASLPIIGLVALLHNMLKIKHDAYRFLKLYRRPVAEQVPDIQGWNQVIQVVTVLGCISNTFVVAFRSNFIHRALYKRSHNDSLEGYTNSTLSKFAVKDLADGLLDNNVTYCFYRGFRYPPDHEKKYEPTDLYWEHLAVRAVYFIILEKMTFFLALILSYLIPETPRKVKVKLEHDEKLLKAAREAQMEEGKGR